MKLTRKPVFENHFAVVTGASQGIGRAIALGLAAKEAMLFLIGRNTAALQEVTELARKSSPRVMAHAEGGAQVGEGREDRKSVV